MSLMSSFGEFRLRTAGFFGGILAALAVLLFADLDPANPVVTRAAAVALLMAIWWITEAVPLAVTALLPLVLFPVLGVQDGRHVSTQYFNWIIFLFIGGFLVALAMQRWNLHRRIALRILLLFGVRPRNILVGFMAATGFLSMWISNTATTMMMVPIALAVAMNLEELAGAGRVSRFSTGILLGIAYSASIMGIATLVGTPPNLVLAGLFEKQFPDAPAITFAQWMLFGLPLSLVLFGGLATYLIVVFCPRGHDFEVGRDVIRRQYDALGPMSFEEKIVLADFIGLALLWLTRADLEIGALRIPGWASLFPAAEFLNDGTVAIAMALLLFFIPARREGASRLLEGDVFRQLPWGIVILFGGGFALASGFEQSGLSLWVGEQMRGLGAVPPIVLVLLVCLIVTFLTELTSNTASAQILLPILANLSIAIGMNPLLLMIAGTVSCSCAFMLPVATPPNAIVFGTDRVSMPAMAKTGFLLNIFGAVIVTLAVFFLGRIVFGIDVGTMPGWAQ